VGPRSNRSAVLYIEPNSKVQKMPSLFYSPLIIWIDHFKVAQDEMRVPVKVSRLAAKT
jgi:hypothetical protein